jgi:hypothetical protein
MGFLRQVFGPSKKEMWKSLSEQIGAEYIDGGFWKGDKVEARVGEWTVTLDTYTVSNGKTSTTYTRIRAPYVNRDGFRFTIYSKSFFSDLGKFLGMQDIEVGDEAFDRDFIIKGSDEAKVRALFQNESLRQLIQCQPHFHLTVKDDEGWFGEVFPEGVDELYFGVAGVIKDIDRLKGLYGIFAEVLHQLCLIGSAYEENSGVVL